MNAFTTYRALCYLLLVTTSQSWLAAQPSPLQFDVLSTEQGLSHHFVRCLEEDQHGFIWIGTNNGLNRYDGYEFTVYTHDPEDSTSLQDNNIWTLYTDRQGTLWVGSSNGLSAFDPIHEQFQHFDLPQPENNEPNYDFIMSIQETANGILWAINGTRQLFRLDKDSGRLLAFPLSEKERIRVFSCLGDQKGNLWLDAGNSGLFCIDATSLEISKYAGSQLHPDDPTDSEVLHLLINEAGTIQFVSQKRRLRSYNPVTNRFQLESSRLSTILEQYPLTTPMLKDRDGNWWFSAIVSANQQVGGIYYWDQSRDTVFLSQNNYYNSKSLGGSLIRAMLEDQQGGIWIGTVNNGLSYYHKNRKPFLFHPLVFEGKPETQKVKAILEKDNGDLLIGSGRGIYSWNASRGVYMLWEPPLEWTNGEVNSFCRDRWNGIWLGTKNGAYRIADINTFSRPFSGSDPSIIHFAPNEKTPKNLGHSHVVTVYSDSQGRIWIGTLRGLFQIRKEAEGFIVESDHSRPTDNFAVWELLEGSDSSLWMGTVAGFHRYDPATDAIESIPFEDENNKNLNHKVVFDFIEPISGEFWIASHTGLYHYSKSTGQSKSWQKKEGFADDFLRNILADHNGNLWLLSTSGLSKFSIETEKIANYQPSISFPNQGPQNFIYTQTGEMIYGVTGGIIRFKPDEIHDNPSAPPIVLTDLQLLGGNQAIKRDSILRITHLSDLKLAYAQNDFAIHFSALNYLEPEKNQYQYRLLNYQKNWISTNASSRVATYTNLAPRTYTFQLRATNNDGIWNPEIKELKITILPPWWATTWAYLIYLILFVILLWLIYHFQSRRRQLKLALELEHREAERIKELDLEKTKFYTNITHEFRTPLTVIIGLAGQLKEQLSAGARDNLLIIQRNGRRLLHLVNELLDLSKIEAGHLSLEPVSGDIINYLQYLTAAFESHAAGKQVRLHFVSEVPALQMDFDPKRLQQVLSNLLSNAIKFTPEGKDIYVLVETQDHPAQLQIKVKDTGIGIPSDQLPNIFRRFYQADQPHANKTTGTGIGLSLVRELVQLMSGTIQVQSTVREGTTFTIQLPISRTAPPQEEPSVQVDLFPEPATALSTPIPNDPSPEASPKTTSTILLIEDNPDVLHYLQLCLQANYQLAFAADGRAGIDQALELVPDIIISDVMMPYKDGYEVCAALKDDRRTSHIPIILLTAKSTQDAKIQGLRAGADAYLSKPFDQEELYVRIEQLLQLRRALQQKYADFSKEVHGDRSINREEQFLSELRQVVQQHLSDEQFGITGLCRSLGMSRTQIHNKLKALTGQSTSHYVRAIRIDHAKQLLKTTDLNISEVAYEVGFKTPVYFSQAFTELVGVSPTKFREGN